MYYLKKFNNIEEYNDNYSMLIKPCVSYIVDQERSVYAKYSGGYDSFGVGSIVFSNDDGKRKIVDYNNFYNENLEGYTAIGIIVVPSSHTKKGKHVMMSLEYFRKRWDFTKEDIDVPQIPDEINYNNFVSVANIDMLVNNTLPPSEIVLEGDDYINGLYFLSDFNDTIDDSETYAYPYRYGLSWNAKKDNIEETYLGGFIPSPYDYYGDKNPNFHRETVLNNNNEEVLNALSLLNGKEMTHYLFNEYPGEPYYPTNLFHDAYYYTTKGTKIGDWFLPSFGELCYMYSRTLEIKNSLELLGINSEFLTQSTWTSLGKFTLPQMGFISNNTFDYGGTHNAIFFSEVEPFFE